MSNYGINHESGTLKRVMVHHPGKELQLANDDPVAHNFEMPVDINQFANDHQELTDALTEKGVEVINVRDIIADNPKIMDQLNHCPNLVFVRDSSTITNKGVFLFSMGLPTRRKETPVIKAVHEALGLPIALHMKESETFEGGSLALIEGRVALAGLCDRSSKDALDRIGGYLLGKSLVDLWIELVMPKGIIHIDGEFCELPGKLVILHPNIMENVTTIFRTEKESWVGSFTGWLRENNWDIIEITDQECFNMAANFLTIDKDLSIHYTGNPRVMKEVNDRGIEVIQIPGKEMRKGMGGIHCMTCPILRV